MKYKTSRILVLLAAAAVALSAAGCSGNKKESSPAEEPSEQSAAVSQTVSTAEGSDTTEQTSKSPTDDLTGYWSTENENGYINVRIMDNGDAVIMSDMLEHAVLGKWSLSGKALTLTFNGEKYEYELKDGSFVSKDGKEVLKRGAISPSARSGEASGETSFPEEKDMEGTWSSSYNGETVDLRLSKGGSAMITNSSHTGETYGKWVFLEDRLTLFVNDVVSEFRLEDGSLTNVSDPQNVFTRGSAAQMSEESRGGYTEGDIYGQWAWADGSGMVVFMTFTDDGMVQITGTDIEGTIVGLWQFEAAKVTIDIKGEPKVYNYNGAFLIADGNEDELFYKT